MVPLLLQSQQLLEVQLRLLVGLHQRPAMNDQNDQKAGKDKEIAKTMGTCALEP